MPSLAEKINRLIRLSASSNMNEARNAAYQACRLLREHGIYLKEPKSKVTSPMKNNRPATNITMRVCVDEEQAKGVIRDYENAGYVVNEEKTVNATIRNDKQTVVLERGNREMHVQKLD